MLWWPRPADGWSFAGFESVGAGFGIAGSGGWFSFCDGLEATHWFNYVGLGAGATGKIKVPAGLLVELLKALDLTVAAEAFPSTGVLFKLTDRPLSARSLDGNCLFFDAGAGLVAGAALTGMLINYQAWPPRAEALLFMVCAHVGIQLGAGLAVFSGRLWHARSAQQGPTAVLEADTPKLRPPKSSAKLAAYSIEFEMLG